MQFLFPEIRTQNIIQQKPIWFPDRSGVTAPIWKSKRSGLKNDYHLNPIWNFMRSGSIGQCLRSGKKMRSGNDGDLGRSGNYGDLARSGNRSDLVLAITLKIKCSLVNSVPGRTRSPNKHKSQNDPKTRPRKECQIGVRSGTAPNARSHFLIWNDLAIWIQNETIWPDHFRSARGGTTAGATLRVL